LDAGLIYTQTILAGVAMIAAYIVGKIFKLKTEICLLLTVIAGGLVGGAGLGLFRHMAEGSATFLDIALIFVFATLFMNILKESGGINFLVKKIISGFHNKKILLLILLMIIILIPGALTGAGSISVLVVGGTVAAALNAMGLTKKRTAAIIFIVAGLSAACPPVNVWAMMTCAGTAIPYVGFTFPLLIPVLITGLFTVLFLGRGAKNIDKEAALSQIESPKDYKSYKIILPFVLLIVLLMASRIWPFDFPVLGLPLVFAICAFFAWLLDAKSVNIVKITKKTVEDLTPLVATTVVVGMLLQIMSMNGTRGLISMLIVTAPVAVIFIMIPFVIPISEGVLTYGGAMVFGIPLIWMFNSMGLNPVIILAGLSLMWPLGDALPPTALIGRLTVSTAGYEGKYSSFLKECIVPWIVITVVGMIMVLFSNQLSFLMFTN